MISIRTLLGVVMTSVVFTGGCSQTDAKTDPTSRRVQNLDAGWKFALQDADKSQISSQQLNTQDWTQITVPHSWNRAGYYLTPTELGHTAESVNTTQGVGTYQLKFMPVKAAQNGRYFLEFDAVSRTAQVWLNGQYIGEHRGGFNRFRFDVTSAIEPGQSNTLVVKADNSKPEPGSATADVMPIAGDFFVHGGIYRPVRLITTDAVHIDMLDFGGPGVYATAKVNQDHSASVSVTSHLRNDDSADRAVDLVVKLLDKKGKVAASQADRITLPAGQVTPLEQTVSLRSAHLWQGIKDPYLYTLSVSVADEDGRTLDTVNQAYGIRNIDIAADTGLTLNGESLSLKGVAYHQDRENRGWAVTQQDVSEDVAMMMDMGANTIRLAHYPHGQTVHQLANEKGLLLWDEIPLVSAWRYGSAHEQTNQALFDNARLQLKEMIKQNFNHPSVAVWGLANEVDFGALIPKFVQSTDDKKPNPLPLLKQLAEDAEQLDASRYSTLANCCEGVPQWKHANVPKTTDLADTTGLNRYFGWYYGQPSDLDAQLTELHTQYPEQPLAVSEYGAGGGVSLHTDNVHGGPVAMAGHDQPEEYMAYVHEQNWAVIADKSYLWASWIWNAFDFATTTRREGDSVDINTKGLITYDRQTKKDPFYFYQANWTQQPVVHITSGRYTERDYQTVTVKVYSNQPDTRLSINGKALPAKAQCEQSVCVWENLQLQAGDNKIVASAGNTQDSVNWHLADDKVNRYLIDAGALMGFKHNEAAYGSDAFFEGGKAQLLDKSVGWGKPKQKAVIEGSTYQALDTTYRAGQFGYSLPLQNGQYTVTVTGIVPQDTDMAQFTVTAEQAKSAEFKVANSDATTAVAQPLTMTVDVTDGTLDLAFTPGKTDAFVSAIQVTPAS